VELAQTLGEAALVIGSEFSQSWFIEVWQDFRKTLPVWLKCSQAKPVQDDVITPLGTVGPENINGLVRSQEMIIASLMDRSKVEMTLKSLSARYKYI
jgi:hypothetical protein